MSDFFPQVTELGARVDVVQFFLIIVMAVWFIACNAVLVYFMFRYKRKGPDDETSTIRGSHVLEIVWTVVPTVMCVIIFIFGIKVWTDMRTIPSDADADLVVNVTGQKWSWAFAYPEGQNTVNELYVPEGKVVKLRMNSKDVLHSFFIPEFRIKEDVVPSMFTYMWFKADKAGVYNLFCTEYCGDDHSGMLGKVHVLDPDTWERFENNLPLDPNKRPLTPLEQGEKTYNNLCKSCHSIDGSPSTGPTFQGLMGRTEELEDGTSITINDDPAGEAYLVESINRPKAKVVKGFPANQMPAFEGQFSNEDLANIITYIKTLK